jgi:hypothetical protein
MIGFGMEQRIGIGIASACRKCGWLEVGIDGLVAVACEAE